MSGHLRVISSRNRHRYLNGRNCIRLEELEPEQAAYHISEAVSPWPMMLRVYPAVGLFCNSNGGVIHSRKQARSFSCPPAQPAASFLSCPLKRLRGSGKIVKSQHKKHKRLKRASRRINFDCHQRHLNIARTRLYGTVGHARNTCNNWTFSSANQTV